MGNQFDVKITDPCLSPFSYDLHTSTNVTTIRYELGGPELEFWVWFESSLDIATRTKNYCGPLSVSLQANTTTESFMKSTFDHTNNTLKITATTITSADLGWHLNQV